MPRELNTPTPNNSPSVVRRVIFFHRVRLVRNLTADAFHERISYYKPKQEKTTHDLFFFTP